MIDTEILKRYMNASRDAKFYQSEDYGQIHDLSVRMEEMNGTIKGLPKLMETLMMADIYMNSAELSDEVKAQFKQVREDAYSKIAKALIALAK